MTSGILCRRLWLLPSVAYRDDVEYDPEAFEPRLEKRSQGSRVEGDQAAHPHLQFSRLEIGDAMYYNEEMLSFGVPPPPHFYLRK